MLTIVVFGKPAPQGSKHARPIYSGKGASREFTGKVATVESSKQGVKEWRTDVKDAAEKLIRCECTEPDCGILIEGYPLDGPLVARIVFSMPQSAAAKKRGDLRPTGMPDLSKLLRSTEDALTAAGVWKDDARLVEYERLAKVWAGSDDPDALPVPGARIVIRTLAEVTNG